MDEMQMVRDLYGEATPDPEFQARLKGQLAGAPPRRRRPALPATVGLSGLAAAAATVVAITSLGTGTPAERAPALSTAGGPRAILLAAAETAGREPIGTYWRTHTVHDGKIYAVGSGKDGYVIGSGTESDSWTPRSTSRTLLTFHRSLGVRPTTESAWEAWRRAGSPRRWTVRTADQPRQITLTMSGPGRWETHRMTPKDLREVCGADKTCDYGGFASRERQLAKPGGLAELLFNHQRRRSLPPAAKPPGVLSVAASVLTNSASPQVRQATFRLLADQPFITQVGNVRDMRGRPGIALSARGTTLGGGTGVFDFQLILDPATYKILGLQYVVVKEGTRFPGVRAGTVVERTAFLHLGWTNETPHHP